MCSVSRELDGNSGFVNIHSQNNQSKAASLYDFEGDYGHQLFGNCTVYVNETDGQVYVRNGRFGLLRLTRTTSSSDDFRVDEDLGPAAILEHIPNTRIVTFIRSQDSSSQNQTVFVTMVISNMGDSNNMRWQRGLSWELPIAGAGLLAPSPLNIYCAGFLLIGFMNKN